MKGRIYLQKIRRIEVDALRKHGYSDYVKHSYSRKPTYYVVTEPNVLQFLDMFRSLIKVK
jgi:hypothetical protein